MNAVMQWLDGFGAFVAVERPVTLALGLVVAALLAVTATRFEVMSRLRRVLSAVARFALLAIILLCVCGVSTVRSSDRVTTVAVLDLSESVRRFGSLGGTSVLNAPLESLRAGVTRRADDALAVVAFDGRATAVLAPTTARTPTFDAEPPGADGTNIESALRLARALVPSDAMGRIVLLSDGNQTAGDANRAARDISGGVRPVPIDVVPLTYALKEEVFIAGVDAPGSAPSGSTVRLRVSLVSTTASSGTLRVFAEGSDRALASFATELDPGESVKIIDVPLGPGRVHRFRAVFEPRIGIDGRPVGDTLTENNAASAFTLTPGAGSVLILEGQDQPPESQLARTLREEGLQVEAIAARQMLIDPLWLQAYDLVSLENVGAEEIDERAQVLLADAVRDMGLGLVMVGGLNSFGAGGWRTTALEPVLPVLLDLPERLIVPEAAVVFVLDNSGSMRRSVMGSSRSQQEIANQAAAMALGALDRRDLVGIIAFNSDHDVIKPLGPNRDPGSTASAILSINSGGGTNLAPALVEASQQLRTVEAKHKHVIVLSDGVSQDKDTIPAIAERMAADDIRLSTIAIGDAADAGGMEEWAKIGKGQFHQVTNPAVLPQVFLRAVRVLRTPLVREEPFTPIVESIGSALTSGLGDVPQLLGLSLTQPRPEPTVINAMITPQGEPLLSYWRVELGQVAAFTSDASRWAANWIEWPGYRRLWTQLARTIGRSSAASDFVARSTIADGRMTVRIDSGESIRADRAFGFAATVFGPDGKSTPLTLAQVGPRTFEGSVPSPSDGAYVAIIRPSETAADGTVTRATPIVTGASAFASDESRAVASNNAWMEAISKQTNGRVFDSVDAAKARMFDRDGLKPVRSQSPVWPWLLIWIPVVFVFDVAVRRIAWDRWFERVEGALQPAAAGVLERVAQRVEVPMEPAGVGYQGVQLSTDDAARLAEAARDRRRAERLREARETTTQAVREPVVEKREEESGSSLLAAKRRARERFDDETPRPGG
ncbi:MAG: VWA domain-containing protein [Phycisphaerae bacterium]